MRRRPAVWVLGVSIVAAMACDGHGLVGTPRRDGGPAGTADGAVQPEAMSTGNAAPDGRTEGDAAVETGGSPDARDAPASMETGASEARRTDSGDAIEAGGDAAAPVVAEIALGKGLSCALISGTVKCWGWNGYGQLGNGLAGDSLVPVQVRGLSSGVTAIAAGYGHTCAVIQGGAQCWGSNGEGQLGNGTTTNSSVPVQVKGLVSGVTAIAAASVQTGYTASVCALVNGGVRCWGNNQGGQLGDNTTASSNVPVQVQGLTTGATAITLGTMHSCAIVKGGAQCWGANSDGQLGDGTTTYSRVPVQVQGLTSGVTAISAGNTFTCAVVDGGVRCWGGNDMYSTIGSSTLMKSTVPIQVEGLTTGVTAVAAGYGYACAIVDGGAKCWGAYNTLYSRSLNARTRPELVQVPGITSGATAIAASDDHTCAIVNDGMQCWGNNLWGQLGNNSRLPSYVPVQVQFP